MAVVKTRIALRKDMRPEILFPCFTSTTALAGVGPRIAKALEKLGIARVVDLYWHLPNSLVDRRFSPALSEAVSDRVVTLTVRVGAHEPGSGAKRPYRVHCSDDTGSVDLVYFHARPDYLKSLLPVDAERVVSGRLENYRGDWQMTHPDYVLRPEERDQLPSIEAVYPLTAGLSQRQLTKIAGAAIAAVPSLPEWQDAAFLKQQGWPDWQSAIKAAHGPAEAADLEPSAAPRRRLAYDELLANQLALGLVRRDQRQLQGRAQTGEGRLSRLVTDGLPYQLTAAQQAVLAEIAADMALPGRMLRLLQGDVGSGKTVVALLAMLIAVESGAQAALMAPTEILARQHYDTLRRYAEPAGVTIACLTGRHKGRTRTALLEALANGETAIIVGTHALFQSDVAFNDLGLIVIDEQHRFGVYQRLTLTAKSARERGGTDVLVMTATPIPRTLALTAYGDMEISRLHEKPPGRTPVETGVMGLDRLGDIYQGLKRKLAQDERVYWVCPLVSESESIDLAAAEERAAALREVFGSAVGLIHGRMKAAEKDQAMADFAEGRSAILVATTVIEVGVDVPEATVMVIEHAERFGLAQLHQLRGRVGRGGLAGTCILLYGEPLSRPARARLQVMRETDDGFRIAEEDLTLRGAGELLGTRQSGMPDFRVADLVHHGDLLAIARDDARLIMERDAKPDDPRGAALRVLLYLFERDAAVRFLRSG